jgi:hypothetical protein
MISESRLKKIEERAKIIETKDYKYIFNTLEEYEQGKIGGQVDPEHKSPVIILDA